MNATYHGMTDTGMQRHNNEDAFVLRKIWDENHILCVVIDGLGGYEGGEVAAEIAAASIPAFLDDNQEGKALDLLKKAVTKANNDVAEVKSKRPGLSKMGCVLTACIIDLQTCQLNVVHIGDTRLYRITNDGITKLTHDHAIVGYLEETGQLTELDAMNHPYRNVIERFLGEETHHMEDPQFIDAAIFPVEPGQSLLLCSDGLSDMLTSDEILNDISTDCEMTAQKLIADANDRGGRDNITVIAVNLSGPNNNPTDNDPASTTVSNPTNSDTQNAATDYDPANNTAGSDRTDGIPALQKHETEKSDHSGLQLLANAWWGSSWDMPLATTTWRHPTRFMRTPSQWQGRAMTV